jgi:ribulose 1,5-bisphosphate synthetase/thiazole synthase
MNTHASSDLLDVIIVGAGPTVLSAALLWDDRAGRFTNENNYRLGALNYS